MTGPSLAGMHDGRSIQKAGTEQRLLRTMDTVARGATQASLAIERWKGQWNYDVKRMVDGCSYEADGLI